VIHYSQLVCSVSEISYRTFIYHTKVLFCSSQKSLSLHITGYCSITQTDSNLVSVFSLTLRMSAIFSTPPPGCTCCINNEVYEEITRPSFTKKSAVSIEEPDPLFPSCCNICLEPLAFTCCEKTTRDRAVKLKKCGHDIFQNILLITKNLTDFIRI
jgi:hypothetical protein